MKLHNTSSPTLWKARRGFSVIDCEKIEDKDARKEVSQRIARIR